MRAFAASPAVVLMTRPSGSTSYPRKSVNRSAGRGMRGNTVAVPKAIEGRVTTGTAAVGCAAAGTTKMRVPSGAHTGWKSTPTFGT